MIYLEFRFIFISYFFFFVNQKINNYLLSLTSLLEGIWTRILSDHNFTWLCGKGYK